MKLITSILATLMLCMLIACSTSKEKANSTSTQLTDRMEFTVQKIQNEKDGQTLFLKDDNGVDYTTIISPANGNYIELEEGNRIALVVKEIMEMDPAQIISKDIQIINAGQSLAIKYEKTEEEIFWIHSRLTQANGMWGQPMECFQTQKGKALNKVGEWEVLCEEIEHFTYEEGKYYQVKVLKKWLENHENLMDRTPYDLELITVLSREKDETYVNPIKTKISTNQEKYKLGVPIELTMEVENTGKQTYTFLPWGTPMENRFTGDCLNVIHKGKPLNYVGIMVKRMPPTDKDYVSLKSGETITGKVNILDGYQLDKKGGYNIQFKEGKLSASNSIEVEIE